MSKLSWNHQRFNGILNLNFENNSAELYESENMEKIAVYTNQHEHVIVLFK